DPGLRGPIAVGRKAFGKMRVAEVQAEADGREVADVDDLDEMLRRGDGVGEVFEQQLHTERTGKGLQVFDRGQRVIERARVPAVVLAAEVQDARLDRNLLGGFEGALHLVHRGDAG